jgi:hypothetical protein
MLDARTKKLRGRKGSVANLFTGHIFCAVCGGAMRVDTGGARNKNRIRKFQCARYVESKLCDHAIKYPVRKVEPIVIDAVIERSHLVPRKQGNGSGVAELAALQVEIQGLSESIAVIEPKIGKSATMAERWEAMCIQLDGLRSRADKLTIEQHAAQSSNTRWSEVFTFMKTLRNPALGGDLGARERLRGLLSRVEFKIVCGSIPGGIDLTIGDWSDTYPL